MAPVSKRVVVMGSRRRIDIPGDGVRVALQAEEFPSYRFLQIPPGGTSMYIRHTYAYVIRV